MDCWDIKLFMNHGLQKVENFWPPLKKFGGVKKIFFCIFVLSVYRTTYIPKIIQFRVGPVKNCPFLRTLDMECPKVEKTYCDCYLPVFQLVVVNHETTQLHTAAWVCVGGGSAGLGSGLGSPWAGQHRRTARPWCRIIRNCYIKTL